MTPPPIDLIYTIFFALHIHWGQPHHQNIFIYLQYIFNSFKFYIVCHFIIDLIFPANSFFTPGLDYSFDRWRKQYHTFQINLYLVRTPVPFTFQQTSLPLSIPRTGLSSFLRQNLVLWWSFYIWIRVAAQLVQVFRTDPRESESPHQQRICNRHAYHTYGIGVHDALSTSLTETQVKKSKSESWFTIL